ncbi:MAG: hypothetical protein EON86_02205 [Brevundimonas sp.]|nr:MAG: hypothetical protein EON86_02205 [Brevundimonas sp.]
MQAAEIGDLLERQRGVVDHPDRSGLGHQNVGHGRLRFFADPPGPRAGGFRIRRRPTFRPGADVRDIGLFARKRNDPEQTHTAKVHLHYRTLPSSTR